MFTIIEETKCQAFDKDGKSLADAAASSAEARKRAVLRSLGMKALRPSEWAEVQKKSLQKVGPMRIVKETAYRAHENGKPIAEPRELMAAAKDDVAKAIRQKVPKAPRSSEGARAPKKEGES